MNTLQFSVNSEACTACEACVQDCPAGIMAMQGTLPVITEEQGCIRCQHCYAVCPTGAISILGKTPEDATPLRGNLPTFTQMRTLVKGRRSVRRFKQENLDRDDINRLIDTIWHAPTAHNSQSLQITVVDDLVIMKKLAGECFARLAQLAADNRLPEGPLHHFFQLGLTLYKEQKLDIFFRAAPHMVLVSAPKDSPSPHIDTIISLSYFELTAQSMGLGTLWSGLVKVILCDLFPDILERLGIPQDHHLGHIMVFGKPAVRYQRTVERGPARVHRASI